MLEFGMTLLFGLLAVRLGLGWGRLLLRRGATANNLFTGKNIESLAFLGGYFLLLLLALNLPQMQGLPLEWRSYGMQITWSIMRVLLLGFCGMAFVVSWQTARLQVIGVLLLGCLGLAGFTVSERYFLAPIYASLEDNLLPNGIFQQTSNSSCAPSALATILRLWNLDATESSVAKLAGTSRLGTSMPQLITASRTLGLDGLELSPTWEQMRRINRPGVLASWLYSERGRDQHAISLVAMTAGTVTVADPALGKFYELTPQQFDRIWRQQYVPIFRPAEIQLSQTQVADYLHQSGFLPQPSATGTALKQALTQFQTAMGVQATGSMDAKTALLLSGPYLKGLPTLAAPQLKTKR
jgi:predicted double-glycine peptidase